MNDNKDQKPDNLSNYVLPFVSILFFGTLVVIMSVLVLNGPACCQVFNMGNQPNQVGDAIGGMTAPIIGLISAGLMFIAFYVQYNFNKEQSSRIDKEGIEKTYIFLYDELIGIEKSLLESIFKQDGVIVDVHKSINDSFSNHNNFRKSQTDKNLDYFINQIENADLLLTSILELKISNIQKRIAINRASNIYINYFSNLQEKLKQIKANALRQIEMREQLKHEDYKWDLIDIIEKRLKHLENLFDLET